LDHDGVADIGLLFKQFLGHAFLQDDLLGALQFDLELTDLLKVVADVVSGFLLALLC
jgi:hypothetical protein